VKIIHGIFSRYTTIIEKFQTPCQQGLFIIGKKIYKVLAFLEKIVIIASVPAVINGGDG